MSHNDAKEPEEIPSIEQLREGEKQEIKIIELYETSICDKCDDANRDRKKLIENMCVICLEIHDENGLKCVPHSNHINAKCECAYFVHRSCFQKWVHTRPQDTNTVNCLVCSSEGVLVLSYKERIMKVFTNRKCLKLIHCVSNVFCWFCVFMMIWQIGVFVENREQSVYGDEQYYDDLYGNYIFQDDISDSNAQKQTEK